MGKRAFASALAQGLLCEKPTAPLTACGICEACHWFETDNHPDFRLLQPEAADAAPEDAEPTDKKKKRDISVAQVRALADFIHISAHRNGAKVVLIQPAEAMNVNAANALLKNLEEPPPETYFLLVSDRPHLLPATIRSRCQQLALSPPTLKEAAEWLKQNGASNPELALAQAGGAPVLAAELDTDEYWVSRKQFLDGLSSRAFEPLALAEKFATHPVPQLINWLQRWTYDLASLCFQQRLRYNPDFKDALTLAANKANGLEMLRFHRELVRFQRIVNHPLNARLLIEDLMLRYGQLLRVAPN
ncbi:MAG: DNA polymerase III subunit delta' C-terminal domain-containing protein [Burkholderiales bacterium]